jgi:hypothetical protein
MRESGRHLVRGFSLAHDPEGSHYRTLTWTLKQRGSRFGIPSPLSLWSPDLCRDEAISPPHLLNQKGHVLAEVPGRFEAFFVLFHLAFPPAGPDSLTMPNLPTPS